jgi:hypothetical protein
MSRSHKVEVGGFEAVFRQVELHFGLTVDAVRITVENASIVDHPFKVAFDRPGKVLATVSADNLAKFLSNKSPGGLRDFDVKIEGNKLVVSASIKVVVDVRARAICALEIREGKEIWVKLEDVEVLGVGARRLVEKQLEKINPVLDVSQFPVNIELESTSASEGELILVGRLKGI